MPAGWPLRPGCCSQISSGTIAGSTCSGRDCSSLKPASSIAHSISTGWPASCSHLRSRRPSVTASPGVRHGSLTRSSGTSCGAETPCSQVSRWPLRPASTVRRKPFLPSTMRSGTTSPCAIAEPRPQVARDQHLAFGGLAQAAARRARRDQRLDQHAHRGVGRRQLVIVHVAARVRGPQRRPAGAHRGEEFGFVGEPEEAFELAGEIGALAVLDQRRGAHHAERAVAPAARARRRAAAREFPARSASRRAPGGSRSTACARSADRPSLYCASKSVDAEMAQLMAIGLRRERRSRPASAGRLASAPPDWPPSARRFRGRWRRDR